MVNNTLLKLYIYLYVGNVILVTPRSHWNSISFSTAGILREQYKDKHHRFTEWLWLAGISGPIWSNSFCSRETQSRGPTATFRWFLEISKEENSQPLGNLCQCSGAHTTQKCFWCSGEPHALQPVPTAFWTGTRQPWTEPSSIFAPFLCWALSSTSVSLLCWVAQNWTLHSRSTGLWQ